jgi:hypothetical protein
LFVWWMEDRSSQSRKLWTGSPSTVITSPSPAAQTPSTTRSPSEVIAGPLTGEAGVVMAELDLSRISAGRRMFDPTGHYSRPDVFTAPTPLRRVSR